MKLNRYFLLFACNLLFSGCLFLDISEDDTYYKIPTPKGDYLILRSTGLGWMRGPEYFEILYKNKSIGGFNIYNDGVVIGEGNFKARWVNTVALELITNGDEQKDGFYIIKIANSGGGKIFDITPAD